MSLSQSCVRVCVGMALALTLSASGQDNAAPDESRGAKQKQEQDTAAGKTSSSKPSTRGDRRRAQFQEMLLEQSSVLEQHWRSRGLIFYGSGVEFYDKAIEQRLSEIATPLLPATTPPGVRWRFAVLRDPMPVALALPNGMTYVSTGLLALLENEDQLAGILAHELAHVAGEDASVAVGQQIKRKVKRELLRTALLWSAAAGVPGPGAVWLPMSLWSDSYSATLLDGEPGYERETDPHLSALDYSKQQEQAADEAAVAALVRAKRDPAQFVRAVERLSTPVDASRRGADAKLDEQWQIRLKHLRELAPSKAGAAEPDGRAYFNIVEPAVRDNFSMAIASGAYRSALANAQRLLAAHPDDADLLCLVGRAYRALGARKQELDAEDQTLDARRASAKQEAKRTDAELTRKLAAKDEGAAALRANRQQAEAALKRAVQLDPKLARPHFELALLYEDGRRDEAREEFRRYLELNPHAGNRGWVEHRVAALARPESRAEVAQ